MKQYRLRFQSYDLLARRGWVETNNAIYNYVREVWMDGRRYIIARRAVYGTFISEEVKVVIRHD